MLAYLRLTLRQALRLPALWALSALGVLATLAALGLSVLALGGPATGETTLLVETAQTTAALVMLWLLAQTHDADQRSGFVQAADQTRGGVPARYVGRLVGSALVAVLATIPTAVVGAQVATERVSMFSLLVTTITPALLLGAWATFLLAVTSSAALTVFAGLGLWLAGHLPWGAPGWSPGPWGRLLAALLPGRAAAGHPDLVALASASGLLMLALACAWPVRSTS